MLFSHLNLIYNMKTQKFIGLLSFLLIATFTSCSSDSDGTAVANSTVSAKIDGQNWQSIPNGVNITVTSVEDEGVSQNVLQMVATSANLTVLTLQFPINNLVEGTYTFQGDQAGMLSYTDLSSFSLYGSSAENGTLSVTISNVNLAQKTLSGTFSGTLYDLMESGASKQITNGTFQNVKFETAGIYSNGSMSLSKNGNPNFIISANDEANSKILIGENSVDNSITVNGYALKTDNNFGIYSVKFPKDATAGTYPITATGDYQASYAGNEADDFTVSTGSVTIVSHVGNVVKANFNYTAKKGNITVTVSDGSFEITHLD
ncbi:DUF6252 domain-containing protein [Flavobacterium antarcticum]